MDVFLVKYGRGCRETIRKIRRTELKMRGNDLMRPVALLYFARDSCVESDRRTHFFFLFIFHFMRFCATKNNTDLTAHWSVCVCVPSSVECTITTIDASFFVLLTTSDWCTVLTLLAIDRRLGYPSLGKYHIHHSEMGTKANVPHRHC